MKKLRLSVEDLAVESFATARGTDEPGTVRAHDAAITESCTNCTYDDTLCGLTRACSNAAPLC
ncbi:hypothetical protein [Longimicrobium sp.]|uniref:hypothetical protein n=1 Tax=Longimicrobium sp. TaxID=2029185 RepID=UPI002E3516B0|nr:hypothetical protein [Longimicrobium sp.]HEX6039840.1 hypothetical protein [Longimicrobium sp.]